MPRTAKFKGWTGKKRPSKDDFSEAAVGIVRQATGQDWLMQNQTDRRTGPLTAIETSVTDVAVTVRGAFPVTPGREA